MARGETHDFLSLDTIVNRIFDPDTNRITVDTELVVSGLDLQLGGIYIENARVATDSSNNPQALLVDSDRHLQADSQILDSNRNPFTSTKHGDHRLLDVFVHSGASIEVYGEDSSGADRILKTNTQGELQVDAQIQDSNGENFTSTPFGDHRLIDVFVHSGINVEVDLSEDEDSVQVYGNDGSSNRAIKTDSQGELQVDAQIQDSNGGKFTSTDVGDRKTLDVFVQSGVNVEVDLDQSEDSVQVYGNDGLNNQAIKTDSQGELQTDSQIQDSNEGKFTSTDVGNHKALDVFIQSGVALSTDPSAKQSINMQTVAVGTTATALPGSPLSSRMAIEIYNNSGTMIFLGHDTNVTAWNSAPLDVGGSVKYDLKDNINVYGIQPAGPQSGNNDVRITELA